MASWAYREILSAFPAKVYSQAEIDAVGSGILTADVLVKATLSSINDRQYSAQHGVQRLRSGSDRTMPEFIQQRQLLTESRCQPESCRC